METEDTIEIETSSETVAEIVELSEMQEKISETVGSQVEEMMKHKIIPIQKIAEANGGKVSVSYKTSLEILGNSANIKTTLEATPPKITDSLSDELVDDNQIEAESVVEEAEEQGRKTQVEAKAKKKKKAPKKPVKGE